MLYFTAESAPFQEMSSSFIYQHYYFDPFSKHPCFETFQITKFTFCGIAKNTTPRWLIMKHCQTANNTTSALLSH